jgi:ATP-dependent DNA ligase
MAEVVASKEDGTPDFRALHSGNYTQEILCVWAFDLMQLNGEDLRPFPLVARKRKLNVILRRHEHLYVRHSEPLWRAATRRIPAARAVGHRVQAKPLSIQIGQVRLGEGEVCAVEGRQ